MQPPARSESCGAARLNPAGRREAVRVGEVGQADAAGEQPGLLERADQLAALTSCRALVTQTGHGGTVLVPGEAGVGKTSLLRHFAGRQPAGEQILWTACDHLFVPRPFGPLLALAAALSPDLDAQITGDQGPFDAALALTRALRDRGPVSVVIEDIHWADEATLDVLRTVARRLDSMPVLLILSYRDDDLGRGDPFQIFLGDLAAPGRTLLTITLAALSETAVTALAGPRDVDPQELFARTGGNPFFVTEVLAAASGRVPSSVRDAVLARAARLSGPARDLLDAAAIVPGQLEGRLLTALDPAAAGNLDECLRGGMLVAADGRVAFRHEIARLVIEESMPAGRRAALHRRALAALEGHRWSATSPALMVHHADAAGDRASVARYSVAAADLAAAAGAHREAARLYQRALEVADVAPGDRPHLLERFAAESFMATLGQDGIAALTEALEIHRARGDSLGAGRVLRELARHYGRSGMTAEALASVQESVAVLEQLPPSPELALAYVYLAGNYALARNPEAVRWGRLGIELGEQLGCAEAIYDGLNNVGTIGILAGDPAGVGQLERSRQLAADARDSLAVARAYLHLCWSLSMRREWLLAGRYFEPGISYCRDHGMELWHGRLRSLQMEAQLALGQWDEAAEAASSILAVAAELPVAERCNALRVLGTVRARRGESPYWPLLDEARELSKLEAADIMLAPVAAARAEAAWLEGRAADILTELGLAAGEPRLDPLASLDLLCWRSRAGAQTGDPAALPEPYRAFLSGDRLSASRWWQARGSSYESAIAMIGSGNVDSLRTAAEQLRELGARPAITLAGRELRTLGLARVPRAPRRAQPIRPAGLTEREAEILELLAAGLRNADIAVRLVISRRTVDHHVSAILKKLNVRTRLDAVTAAVSLGIVRADMASPVAPARRGRTDP